MINKLLGKLDKYKKRQPVRYGIYYNGIPVYISTVNVYKTVEVAKRKIKEICTEHEYDSGWTKTTISDKDLQHLLDSKVIEIKPIV